MAIKNTFEKMPANLPKEEIVFYVDDGRNTEIDLEKARLLKRLGVRSRYFIVENDTMIAGDLSQYRYWPQKDFTSNTVIWCYGGKVAFTRSTRRNEGGVIVESTRLAETIAGIANVLWDKLPEPRVTTMPKNKCY